MTALLKIWEIYLEDRENQEERGIIFAESPDVESVLEERSI
jgi:hypothetical protein